MQKCFIIWDGLIDKKICKYLWSRKPLRLSGIAPEIGAAGLLIVQKHLNQWRESGDVVNLTTISQNADFMSFYLMRFQPSSFFAKFRIFISSTMGFTLRTSARCSLQSESNHNFPIPVSRVLCKHMNWTNIFLPKLERSPFNLFCRVKDRKKKFLHSGRPNGAKMTKERSSSCRLNRWAACQDLALASQNGVPCKWSLTSSFMAASVSILFKSWVEQDWTTIITKQSTPVTRRMCKSDCGIPTDKWHRWNKKVQPYDGSMMYQKLQEFFSSSGSSRVWVNMSAISNGVRYSGRNGLSKCMC